MQTVKVPKIVVIKRSKWLRGDLFKSCLLNDKGEMCCLGFLARKIGFTSSEILDINQPDDLSKRIIGLAKPDGSKGSLPTKTADALMRINDCEYSSDEEREKKIKSLGKKIGVTFKFVD